MRIREEIRQGTLRGTQRCSAGATADGRRERGRPTLSFWEAEIFNLFAPFLAKGMSDEACILLQTEVSKTLCRMLSTKRERRSGGRGNASLD